MVDAAEMTRNTSQTIDSVRHNWDRAEAESCGVPTPGSGSTAAPATAPGRVSLGLPTLRVATSPIYDLDDGQR